MMEMGMTTAMMTGGLEILKKDEAGPKKARIRAKEDGVDDGGDGIFDIFGLLLDHLKFDRPGWPPGFHPGSSVATWVTLTVLAPDSFRTRRPMLSGHSDG